MGTIWERALKVIPGGVNSPVRSFSRVDTEPIFVRSAQGAEIIDARGEKYLDFVMSWGALIFGHSFQPVIEKVRECLGHGTSYGLATELEVEMAEVLVEAVPSLEMVRLVNSGTEATMSAIRLARAFTGREKIVKFSGCYHGHSNELLVGAGSGALTFGVPESKGVTAGAARDTIVLPYNDLEALEETFAALGPEIAAVIVEPVAANMGLVLPEPGFLPRLREITLEYGSLLIFDEVITGFRLAYGGAQEVFGVNPDLTCLGKIIGGGFPIGAYGGRRCIMELVSPLGPVYQAGTLSGNPVAVTAGLQTLKLLADRSIYDELQKRGERFRRGLREIAAVYGVEFNVSGIGSLTGIFFCGRPVKNYEDTMHINTERYKRFFQLSLEHKILFPPSPYETVFISTAHQEELLVEALEKLERVFATLARESVVRRKAGF